ncbi:MAG TPA: ATP-binding protein [Pirellulales bacterium]|nr:ATP-binding protein [Pirellulales bacterium]
MKNVRRTTMSETDAPHVLPFAIEPALSLAACNIRDLIDEVGAKLTARLHAQRVVFEMNVPSDLQVSADRGMLLRALTSLMHNALDSMPRGGELVITGYAGRLGVELEVADSGPGLPASSATLDTVVPGLSQVRRFAAMHGGDVMAANCPEGGAAFTIRLPCRRSETRAA